MKRDIVMFLPNYDEGKWNWVEVSALYMQQAIEQGKAQEAHAVFVPVVHLAMPSDNYRAGRYDA
jgi:hypothetical protein